LVGQRESSSPRINDDPEFLTALGGKSVRALPEGVYVMGSTTYEWMLRHVVGPDATHPEPWPYTQPTWILTSRTLPPVPGADIRWARGDVRPLHAEMARASGGRNIWVVGGGEVVGQFHDHGLLDESFVQVGSVTLGSGKPLLPRVITSPSLRLLSARAVGPGFAELHYEVPRSSTKPPPPRP
jgi:dihydrofolate reductase